MSRKIEKTETWVFDLDHTLYPPQSQLFSQIEARMVRYICRELSVNEAEADRLRALYWTEHGTTLAGLMAEHRIAPMPFLDEVHDIDMGVLSPDPRLGDALSALGGRKIIFTNGDAAYAARVLAALGLDGAFDAIYGIEHAGFVPKPAACAFDAVRVLDGFAPEHAAMFEDTARNLEVPHLLGMACILVQPDPPARAAHIHYHTDDLAGFLSQAATGALPQAADGISLENGPQNH